MSDEPSWWDKFDIGGKMLIGVAGLALSIVLGYREYTDREKDHELRIQEQKLNVIKDTEAQRTELKDEFRAYYSSARASKRGDTLAISDLDLANTIAQTLKAKYGDGFYLDAALGLQAHLLPSSGSGGRATGATFQAVESTTPSTVPTRSDQWYAVLASYPVSPAGLDAARTAAERASKLGCIQIWQTKVSNSYAVVYGGKVSRSVALVNAQAARSMGVAANAFVQADRGWAKSLGCPT